MKNKLMLPLLSLLALAAAPLHAQYAPVSTLQATAPYRMALGLRYSPSPMAGPDAAISIKHFFWRESAVEAQVGRLPYRNAYQASLHYIWQPQLLSSSRFRPYAGIGVGITGTNRDLYGERQHMKAGAVGMVTIGIEYTFPKAPIALSVDYRHTFVGYKTDYLRDVPLERMSNLGFSLKYIIR